jgi:hypothetical protein
MRSFDRKIQRPGSVFRREKRGEIERRARAL